MADLTTIFAGGIRCPNPFWLASGPPANCGEQVMRAFDAGWGGAVWKTLGEPIVNVSSRYSSVDWNRQRMMGLNNIELITDRPLHVNLREISEVKKRYPAHAVIASLMVESKREAWHEIVRQAEDAGADGLELNFGCPHGMSERGMGSAVGQVPEYTEMITEWVKEVARTPVLVKLTPNISDIRMVARAAKRGGAGRPFRHQHHQLDHRHRSGHAHSAARCRRPILARRLLRSGRETDRAASGAADRDRRSFALPISGIGGISGWQEAAEFILMGAGTVQVCTAAMHYGFRIVEDMIDGLSNWMDEKGFRTLDDFRGLSLPRVVEWKNLDLNYKIIARIHPEKCIGCDLCYTACWDGAHQCIHLDRVTGANGNGHRTPADSRSREQPPDRDDANRQARRTPASTLGPYATPLARIPRVDEDRMRRLQSVRAGLPGGWLHHHGARRYWHGHPNPGSSAAALGKGGQC